MAYELRISDWNSDVCSTDLLDGVNGEIEIDIRSMWPSHLSRLRKEALVLSAEIAPVQFRGEGHDMSKKNAGFAADLVAGMDPPTETPPRRASLGVNVLAGRTNRLAELASGSAVTRTQELVDPARCRMWEGHNRE